MVHDNVSSDVSTDVAEVHREIILDHAGKPRNFGELTNPTIVVAADNPSCGDQIRLQLKIDHGGVSDARFTGKGCAICLASASLMTRSIRQKSVPFVHALHETFHAAMQGNPADESLGDLLAIVGVSRFPMRIKCALLPWETLRQALSEIS